MNEIVGFCSDSLLARLARQSHPHESPHGSIVSLADARIRRDIRHLPPLESRVLRWRHGVDCTKLDDNEIAARLRLTVEQVAQIGDQALMELGFLLVSGSEAA